MFEKLAAVTAGQWAFAALVVAACFAFSAWAILDAWSREYDSAGEKVGWVQLIIFIPILGALAYVLIGRKRGEKIS